MNGVVLSTDNYFVNNKGQYVFDKRKLDDAHAFNKSKGKCRFFHMILQLIALVSSS